jgi:hypothetical protein
MEYSLVKWSRVFYKKHKINNGYNWFENNYSMTNQETTKKIKNNTLYKNVMGCLDFLFLPFFEDGKFQKKFEKDVVLIEKVIRIVFEHLTGTSDSFDILSLLGNIKFELNKFEKSTECYVYAASFYEETGLSKFRNIVNFLFVLLSFLVDMTITFQKITNEIKFLSLLHYTLSNPLKKWVVTNNVTDDIKSKQMFFAEKFSELEKFTKKTKYEDFFVEENSNTVFDKSIIMNIVYNVSGLYMKSTKINNFTQFLYVLDMFHVKTLAYESEQFKKKNSLKINGLDYLELIGLYANGDDLFYSMSPYIEINKKHKLLLLFFNLIQKNKRIQYGEGLITQIKDETFNYSCVKVDTDFKHVCLKMVFQDKKFSIKYYNQEIEKISEDRFAAFTGIFKKSLTNHLQKSIIKNKDDRTLVDIMTYLLEINRWDNFFKEPTNIYFSQIDLETLRNLIRDWDDSVESKTQLTSIIHDNIINNHQNGEEGYKLFYYDKEDKNFFRISNSFNLEELVYGIVPFMNNLLFELSEKKNQEVIEKMSDVLVEYISNILSTSLSGTDEENLLLSNQTEIEKVLNGSLKDAFETLTINKLV